MTTTKQSHGCQLKDTIKSSQDKAVSTIENFLQDHLTLDNGAIWHLHVFCRTGKGEDYGFDMKELWATEIFFELLMQLFMDPVVSKKFEDLSDVPALQTAELLVRLNKLFSDLNKCKFSHAQLDLVEHGRYSNNAANHNTICAYYERESALINSRSEIIENFKGRFEL